ncbi:MAG: hypothetical protein Q9220_007825 [cf. Caloplaca sp. 1 TL-2023]
MPTYAIIGATGGTGQQILAQLLQSPNNKVNAYCRSKTKLEKQSPNLASHQHVNVFSGALTDIPLLVSCVANTTAIFLVIGANTSYPGMRIVEDGAHSIVAALSILRFENPSTKLPRILLLSSAGMNSRLEPQLGRVLTALTSPMKKALFYAYEDLGHAEDFLRLQKGWLDVTFIHAGALAAEGGEVSGHTLTLNTPPEGFIGYPDLAAGMIEVAETEGGRWNWEGVGVIPKKAAPFNSGALLIFVRGLVAYCLPPMYWGLRRVGALS